MIRVAYFWVIKKVNTLFLKLLAVRFWGLMLPVLMSALIATKIARWKWADIYTRVVEKLTGHKL